MKKAIILITAILLTIPALSQLEVKPGSFKEVVGFVNINADPDYQYDDNNKPYSVLKIKTENINEQQRARLLFQGDAQTYIMVENKVGEVWLYISYYASYLKISHPDFSSTEFYFPITMQGKKGYELTLTNKYGQGDVKDKLGLTISVAKDHEELYYYGQYIGLYPLTEVTATEYKTTVDFGESIDVFQEAVKDGDAAAQNNLGACYYTGRGVEQDYEKAANNGYLSAKNTLGNWYFHGQCVKEDIEESVKLYRYAAERGFAESQHHLGYCYSHGLGVEKDDNEAFKWDKTAADQGNIAACYNIGYYYEHGKGVNKDNKVALTWYLKASEMGDSDADVNIGDLYFGFNYGIDHSYEEAIKWYEKAASQNNARGFHMLGYCYDNGYGVPCDYKKAYELYLNAVKQDFAPAYNNLGLYYEKGKVVKKDKKKAFEYFMKAAELGSDYGLANVGKCYEKGIGVKRNKKEAIKWYQRAAEQDNMFAKSRLKELNK